MKALGMCGLISRTNLFFPFVRRPKILKNFYSPTPNRFPSFCLVGLFVQLENFSLIWRHHYCRWRDVIFYLCSTLMAIYHWRFFNVQDILWRGVFVYNGHLWGPVIVTPIPECLAVGLIHTYTWVFSSWADTACFLRLRSVAAGIRTPKIPIAMRTLEPTAPPPWLPNKKGR